MTSRLQQIHVAAIAQQDVLTPLNTVSDESCPDLTVSKTTRDDPDIRPDGIDCVLIDQRAATESWCECIDRITDTYGDLPVVALLSGELENAVPSAIRAGATAYIPRSVCESDPELVATRLGAVTGRVSYRELERTYEELFENVSDGLVVHDPETGEMIDCNDQFCQLTGYDRETLIGQTIDFLTAPSAPYSYDRAKEYIEAARTEGPQLFEWRNQHRNGDTYYSEVHLAVVELYGTEYVLASARDITERKRRQREFEQIFNSVQDAIIVMDPETLDILEANEAYLELVGYDSVECLRQQGIDGLSVTQEGYTFEEGREIHNRVAETGESEVVEWQAETSDGDTRFLEVKIAPAVIGGDDVHIAIHRDITERKRRQREFEEIFHGVNDAIAVHEPETGDLLAVNDTLCDIVGYDRETLLEIGPEGVIVEDSDTPALQTVIERVLAGEDVEPYEQPIETTAGERRWLEVNPTRAVIDGQERFLAIARDVSPRRNRRAQLRAERERRSALFDDNPDPVVRLEFVDGRPVIREVNPAFERIFGFDSDTVVGTTVGETLVPDDEREQYEQFRETVADGEAIEREATRQTADGRRRFVFKVIQFDAGGDRNDAYVWYTDVTERRRREQAIRRLQDGTAQMQEAETVSEVATIALTAVGETIGLPEAGCWLYDSDTGNLVPTADTEWTQILTDDPLYELFEEDTVRAVTDPSGLPLERALLLPLGEHGLLAAGPLPADDDTPVLRDIARTIAEQTETALDRVMRAREVRESERRLQGIVDRIDEAIFLAPISEVTNAAPAPEFVSSGYEAIWGEPLTAIHDRYDDGFFATIHPGDLDEYRAFLDNIVTEVAENDGSGRYHKEYRIERPDGEVRWVQSEFYPTEWGGAEPRMVIVSRDITDRKERARKIESFHDATTELTTAETATEAGRIAVEAGADAFALPSTAVYRYDRDTATLEPTATGPSVPEPTELIPLTARHTHAWESFADEQLQQLDSSDTPPLDIDVGSELMLFPLGGKGLLVVWQSGETIDTEAASILAGALEAALNRLRGEQQLQSRQQELQAQTERAQRLDAIAELTQRVDAAITGSSSRDGIREAVCAELIDVEPFVGAWIAAAEVGTDQLTPRTVAGIDSDHAEQVLRGTGPHPAVDAWHEGTPRVVNDLVDTARQSEWRQLLLKSGIGSVCSVPITYNDITYGVLTVLADEPGAFGDRERDVLAQLSTSVGYAITAAERRRALESDDTLELEFTGTDMELPVAQVARETGCRVQHERTIRRQDGSVSVYYAITGDIPDSIKQTATATLPGTISVVSTSDEKVVIERQGSSWFGSLISEYGGILRQGVATPTCITLIVEFPQDADTRTIVERLQSEYPELELTAQRHHRETDLTATNVQTKLHERLSDRQYEALETGYTMGYFDWPRESSGEDVADQLGITQPTVNKHIRLGERKVFDLLFGSN